MHTLLDFEGNLAAYVNITYGKTADNKGACDIPLLEGSVIAADRFYNNFYLLNIWDTKGVYFVIRHEKIWQKMKCAFCGKFHLMLANVSEFITNQLTILTYQQIKNICRYDSIFYVTTRLTYIK